MTASNEYPLDWLLLSLAELNAKRATTVNPKKYSTEQFEYYSIPAYQASGLPTLTLGKEIESSKLLLDSGTILFGKLNPRVEKVWRVGDHFDCRKIGSTEWIPVHPTKEIDGDFLYYLFWSEHVMPKAKTLVSGSTPSRQRVDPKSFYKIRVPVPPLSEQRRIAHVLTTVQTAIEQQARMIDLTRELKSALMKKLFTEGLRGEKQKETEIGFVPEGWEEIRLDKTGDVIYGIQAAVAKNIKPIGMKILTNKNITLDGQIVLGEINYFELKTKRHFETILQKGDILFNWRSGSKEHIGKTAYFDLDGEYTHSSFILRIRPNEKVNGKYLFWYLYNLRAKGYFQQKHNVSSVNTTFNKSAVDALPVFLPKKTEQDEIALILDTVDSKIGLLKRKQDTQEELFRTLLHQLMTGEVRTTDLRGFEDFADEGGADL